MNNTSTIPDSLYDKAFAYFNTELYKTLFDSDIFAVRFTDGEIGYCCLMGMLGEHISLAVYPGKSGLYSFYGINSLGDENISEQEYFEISIGQDCIQCSLENLPDMLPLQKKGFKSYSERTGNKLKRRGKKNIAFSRYRPNHAEWYVTEEKDLSYMEQALEAAIEVAEKLKSSAKPKEELGFTEDASRKIPLLSKTEDGFKWESIELPENVEAAFNAPQLNKEGIETLSKLKKSGSIECKIIRLPFPLQEDKNSAPAFPAMLIAVDSKTGDILTPPSPVSGEKEYTELIDSIAGFCYGEKRLPEKIMVSDELTFNVFTPFCGQIGILLEMQATPNADNAAQGLLGFMGGMGI